MDNSRRIGNRLLSLLLVFTLLLSMTFVSARADTIDVDKLTSTLNDAVLLETLFTGLGTEASPYQITSEEELVMLQLLSNGVGSTMIQEMYGHGNFYFKLTSDITLTTAWTAIAGTAENYFAGTFDGGGHTVSGLAVEETAEAGTSAYAALFGYIDGAEIENLTVNGSVTLSVSAGESTDSTTQAYAGGVVAYALDSAINNCTANVTVTASNADTGTVDLVAGGVAGYIGASSSTASASVSNSTAAAGTRVSVTTSASGDGIATVAGGVVGLAQGADITNNSSAAEVTVSGSSTTYGFATFTSTSTDDYGNNKTVTHDLNGYYYSNTAGGVVGAAVGLYDMGDTMTSGGGGNGSASGYAEVSKTATVTGNTSNTTVTNNTGTTLSFAGGVVGTALFATVSGGEFGGTVNGTYAGGIVGMAAGDDTISGASLTGSAVVTGTTAAGGIAAQLGGHTASNNSGSAHTDSTVQNCTVGSATISAADYAGGAVGYISYSDAVSGCSSAATVSADIAGGVAGYVLYGNLSGSTISSCKSSATVSAGTYGGGILGCVECAPTTRTGAGGTPSSTSTTTYSFTIDDCSTTDSGSVTAGTSAGGIVGLAMYGVNIDGCVNSSPVKVTTDASVNFGAGGIVGTPFYYVSSSSGSSGNLQAYTISNSVNYANVTGTKYVGGIFGYAKINTSTFSVGTGYEPIVTGCINHGTITKTGTTVSGAIGGIAGYDYNHVIINCANHGNVVGDSTTVTSNGGIVGALYETTMLNSYNTGTISQAKSQLGGVAGIVSATASAANCYNVGTIDSSASYTGTLGRSSGILSYSYALEDESYSLYAGTSVPSECYTFNTSQDLAEGCSYSTLLEALNSYVASESTYDLMWWMTEENAEYTYPVLTEDAPTPDVPAAPTIKVGDGDDTSATVALTESVTLIASDTDEGVYFQWYSGTAADGSDREAIGEATTGVEYTTPAATEIGTVYYFVSAKAKNEYGIYSEEVFCASAVAVTVEFSAAEDGTIVYGETSISLEASGTASTSENPYIIDTVDKLKALSSLLTAGVSLEGMYFEQTAKIDASAETDWAPIGTSAQPFDGTYDGGSYTVTLSINSTEDEQALFGYNSGTIANLTVAGSVTTSGAGAAGIVFVNTGIVDNCVNTANVSAAGANTTFNDYQTGAVGGVAAYVSNGTVANSQNSGAVSYAGGSSNYNSLGGVVGFASGSAVTNCVNSGTVTGSARYAGGIGGYLVTFNSAYPCYVYNCANTGAVSGYTYAGGIVGNGSIELVNSYNTGSVSGSNAGGIKGSGSNSVYNCYNAGEISGTNYAGGLVASTSGTVDSSYYLAQNSLTAVGSGSASVSGVGSFDAAGNLTAEDGCTLNYSSSLFNSLQSWAVDHQSEYDLLGWAEQENGYPVLSADVELSELASAAAAVEFAESNVSEANKDAANVTLSATVTLTAADVGTVTYTWYMDGEAVASGDITETLKSSGTASVSVTVDTHTAGVHVYSLTVENAGEYTTASTTVSTTVKVNKPSDDTSWYGDWDIASSFAAGSGTESDPYQISSADELAYLAQEVNAGSEDVSGKYFVLIADIDLNSYTWTPIGTSSNRFTGVFDGDGHTVSEIATSSASDYQGLFGYVGDATIKNLVVSGEVEGTSIVGGIVAYAAGALTLENCGNEADVTASRSAKAGGLIGEVSSSKTVTITGCYNMGSILGISSSTNQMGVGGLAGFVNSPINMSNSYNLGSVTNTSMIAGGLIGELNLGANSSTVSSYAFENCYNAGYVQSEYSAYEYALIGAYYYTEGTVSTTNCYYLTGTAGGDDTDASAVGFITASMLGSAFTDVGSAATFDFSHATVSINGTAVESGAAVAAVYPALAWETDPQRDAASVTFTVTADDDYGVYSVKVGDTELTANDDGSYTVAVDEDITVTVNVKRVSWSGENDAANDIESIIASDAAGTESEDDENSTYDSSLDLNNDGKNDLLDILDILYTESAQSEDSASESTYESADSEETAAEETDEAETDSSDTATESTESTEG